MKIFQLFLISLLISVTALGFSSCGDDYTTLSKLKIETVDIQEIGDSLEINLKIPNLSRYPGAEQLNDMIGSKVEEAILEVRDAASMMKENKMNFKATLNGDYQYSYNNDIASLWIYMDNFTGGAHGMYWLDSYTFNIDNGEIYSFKDLFIENSSGVSLVEGRILKEVENIEKVVTHSRDFSRELVTTYVAHKTAKI